MRPQEGARNVIVRRTPDGETRDVTPAPFNARTRVHEYGGLCFWIADGDVYFANFADQRVYRQPKGGVPEPITPNRVDLRYADGMIDRERNRLVCVREDHRDTDQEAVNTIVALNLDAGGAGTFWYRAATSTQAQASVPTVPSSHGCLGNTPICLGTIPAYG